MKEKKDEKIKILIVTSINNVVTRKNKIYKEIFIRSINYDYKDIEKKLRDRLTIKK